MLLDQQKKKISLLFIFLYFIDQSFIYTQFYFYSCSGQGMFCTHTPGCSPSHMKLLSCTYVDRFLAATIFLFVCPTIQSNSMSDCISLKPLRPPLPLIFVCLVWSQTKSLGLIKI